MKEQLSRLIGLAGADGGFYILAIRSFIEYYMRRYFPDFDDSWAINFNTNLYNYKKYLIEKNPGKYLVELSSFKALMDQNHLAEEVFRDFASVSREEARAATYNFLQFCKVAEIDESLLLELKNSLEYWEKRQSRSEDLKELRKAREELVQLKRENSTLLKQYSELEELRTVKKYLEGRIVSLGLEMEKEKASQRELSQELDSLKAQRIDVGNRLSAFENVDRYIKNLLRVSLYSRTRMDYERTLTELTVEQKEVLDSITLKNDFLIKGGAGTGKTLVLLEAMRRANEGYLAFASLKLLLLTYTTTLVKYDRYISEILKIGEGDSEISTADSYLNAIFEDLYPSLTVEYDLVSRMCGEVDQDIFTDKRMLVREIEDFLWGYGISREEYIDSMISRKGLKEKLSREKREALWKIKEKLEGEMKKSGKVTRAYSRLLLLEKELPVVFDHIFIDESQDLSPVELKVLHRLSRCSNVMAGDTDQSIYGIGSPYRRYEGLTGSSTRILKTNFRNSLPIHELAEKFRKKGGAGIDRSIAPKAFREGPSPELYQANETGELYDQLIIKLRLFLHTIEYDPENICILAPGVKFLDKIASRLEEEGLPSVKIKDPDFDFSDSGRIRLSPLHSSKGIDIPVVMLFLPVLFYNRDIEKEESEALVRNLVYVSMTRAMENLNIFTKEKIEDPVLKDLIDLMKGDG